MNERVVNRAAREFVIRQDVEASRKTQNRADLDDFVAQDGDQNRRGRRRAAQATIWARTSANAFETIADRQLTNVHTCPPLMSTASDWKGGRLLAGVFGLLDEQARDLFDRMVHRLRR